MKLTTLLRLIIIIIIIIGGTIIIVIIRGPRPDPPPCAVCGTNLVKLLSWGEIILGAAALAVSSLMRDNDRIK